MSGIEQYFDLKPQVLELDKKALELCAPEFAKVEAIRDENQWRMLRAFTDNKVSATQLVGSTGYGYDDAGREKLDRVFADLVGAEDALCRSHFLSGTHALTVALFGLLRTGDTLLAATGRPYDTLESVIGIDGAGKGLGSLADYGVKYDEAPLTADYQPDYDLIAQKAPQANRLTCPGVGRELGCTLDVMREMFLGLYYAPGVTCEALKTAMYAQCLLELLGKAPVPRYNQEHNDIVTCFDAGSADALVSFCQGIQAGSPVDSYVSPEPYAMPGYEDEVVMAAGAFTLGSSIELSCDGPLRAPYTCYLQGGLNFAASRAGVLMAVQKAFF